jgi:putative component of membrane protein insertase Oxa1/YidC/SpoIIIJ protein YidD
MQWQPGVVLAGAAITGYQRFISPYKGFRCAYGALHGGPGCSEAVRRLIEAYGLLASWPKVRERFAQCRQAALTLRLHAARAHAMAQERKDKKSDEGCVKEFITESAGECVSNVACEMIPCDCSL